MSHALTAHLEDIRDELERIEDPIIEDLAAGIAMREAAIALVRSVGSLTAIIDAALIDHTTDEADSDGRRRILLPDGRDFIVSPKSEKKRCDWGLFLPVLAARIVDDRHIDDETGEIHDDEPIAEKFIRLLPSVVPMTASVIPKTGGMKDLGIDGGKYITAQRGALEVRIEGSAAA